MTRVIFITILFLLSQTSLAQTKVREYERTNADLEKARLDEFAVDLLKAPESKGLIVIHGAEKDRLLVDVRRDIKAIRKQLGFRLGKSGSDRIFFKVSEGKSPLYKEFWIYPEGAELSITEPEPVNLDGLKKSFLYASVCASCEDATEPLSRDFVDFEAYAALLRQYPSYKSLVVIYPNTFHRWSVVKQLHEAAIHAMRFREKLVKEHKISKERVTIRTARHPAQEAPLVAEFYIIPGK